MSFETFYRSIESPLLRAVAAHWNEARGSRLMPAWADIRPRSIKGQLPAVWSYKFDARSSRFTGRLSGDRITQIIGKDLRGLPLEAVQPPDAFGWVYANLLRVVTEPALYHGAGHVFRQMARAGAGERIVLPLGRSIGDGVLGATEYHAPQLPAGLPAAPVLDAERWDSLERSPHAA